MPLNFFDNDFIYAKCVKTWIMLSFRSPENSLLCVSGQTHGSAPTENGRLKRCVTLWELLKADCEGT